MVPHKIAIAGCEHPQARASLFESATNEHLRKRPAADWLRGAFFFDLAMTYSNLSIDSGKSRTRLPVA